MLIGQYETILGAKSRTSLPSKFRKKLGQRIVIAKWYESCLVVVKKDQLNSLLDRLTGKSQMVTKPVRDTDRFILGSAYDIELDNQGRFVIPKSLVQYANLGTELIALGLRDRVEIWDKLKWTEHEAQISKSASNMLDFLAYEKQTSTRSRPSGRGN